MRNFIFCFVVSCLFTAPVSAAVLQSAGNALSNDIFVSHRTSSAKANKSSSVKHNNSSVTKKTSDTNTSSAQQQETSSQEQEKSSSKTTTVKKKKKYRTKQNPYAGYGYSKKYAKKLFKTFSGHITIEQENIPQRLGVTKGSTIQLNLEETPDTIWSIDLDEKIGKITVNRVTGQKRIVIIQAVASGNTRLFLDNISIKDKKYRVIFSKKMTLLVDDK